MAQEIHWSLKNVMSLAELLLYSQNSWGLFFKQSEKNPHRQYEFSNLFVYQTSTFSYALLQDHFNRLTVRDEENPHFGKLIAVVNKTQFGCDSQ